MGARQRRGGAGHQRLPILPVDTGSLPIGRTYRRGTVEKVRMGNPPAVPELGIDPAAGLVHGAGDAAPALSLRSVVNIGDVTIAVTGGMHDRCFGQNEADAM